MDKTGLSPYGKELLKQVGGSTSQLDPSKVRFWGLDQETSVFHALPDEFKEVVTALPVELVSLPERELEQRFGGVTRQDRQVRINFWEEQERAAKEARGMDLKLVATSSGLPSWDLYAQKLYEQPALLAWLMRAPAHYQLVLKEGQELGMNRLMEILSLPITDTRGKVNVGIAALILQAFKLIDQRRMGGYTQKNVNVNMEAGQIPDGGSINADELDKKIKELELKLGRGPQPQEPIDAELVSD